MQSNQFGVEGVRMGAVHCMHIGMIVRQKDWVWEMRFGVTVLVGMLVDNLLGEWKDLVLTWERTK